MFFMKFFFVTHSQTTKLRKPITLAGIYVCVRERDYLQFKKGKLHLGKALISPMKVVPRVKLEREC